MEEKHTARDKHAGLVYRPVDTNTHQVNDWRIRVRLTVADWLQCVKVKPTSFLEETAVVGGGNGRALAKKNRHFLYF